MDNRSVVDYVRARPFNWIILLLTAVLPLMFVWLFRNVTLDEEEVMRDLIVLCAIGAVALAYKSELKRQQRDTGKVQRAEQPRMAEMSDVEAFAKDLAAELPVPRPTDIQTIARDIRAAFAQPRSSDFATVAKKIRAAFAKQ